MTKPREILEGRAKALSSFFMPYDFSSTPASLPGYQGDLFLSSRRSRKLNRLASTIG